MSDAILFAPYLRRGLATALGDADPLAGSLPRAPEVTAWISVAGARIEQAVRLHDAQAAAGLAAGQVVREEPRADSVEVDPTGFPFVELAAPDLPWLLTPAAPAAHDRLRPWLVLVVVREQDGVTVTQPADGGPAVLSIGAPAVPADELPDLADSWAWTHVQSLVPAEEIEAAVAAGSTDVAARVVCPRRLRARSAYRACLVPAFDGDAADLAPTWDLTTVGAAVELPVYHHWRFTTGDPGDFEALCRRLQPDADSAVMGLHALDVTDPGLVTPAADTVTLDMEGALLTRGASGRPWPATHQAGFQAELTGLLDASITRADVTPPRPHEHYDPATEDPVVGPPAYGALAAGVPAVPASGWVRELNEDPASRAAAGLGARVVRATQDALVAAAWEQAGDLRATVDVLNRARLSAEIGRSWATRAGALQDGDLLAATETLHPLLRDGEDSIASRLAGSAVPRGLLSAAHHRLTRPGMPLARDWRTRTADGSRLADTHVQTTVAATALSPGAPLAALAFAGTRLPDGAQVVDATLEATGGQRAVSGVPPATVPFPGGIHVAVDVSDIAGAVRGALDPVAAVRAAVVARVPALAGLLPATGVPTSVALGPVFEDPLSWDLIDLGSSWLLPEAQALGANRVRLVEGNARFVGAFLVGANYELARELLWHDYPVDVRATFFHRFWNYADPERRDLGDLATDWDLAASLDANLGNAAASMTVIVVRGDVVRRFPTAHWFLMPAELDDTGALPADGAAAVEPAFIGTLDAETAFFGFDLKPRVVRGDRGAGVPGYLVGIEEQAGAPRLGLDLEDPADFGTEPASWDDLSWGHLARGQRQLDALTHARATGTPIDGLEIDGTRWGRNAGHMARATWQRPFRLYIHADVLV